MPRARFIHLLLVLLFFAIPVVAHASEENPVARMVQQAKDGTISQDELAAALIVQAEIDQAAIPNPDTLILRFPGFAELIGKKLELRTAELIRENNPASGKQLELFAQRMLGGSSKYTTRIVNLNRLSDQFERLVSRGTPDTVLAFRASLSSDVERELFLGRVDEFLQRIITRHSSEPPFVALRNLALLGDAARAAGADSIVAELFTKLVAEAKRGALNWDDWSLSDLKVERFVLGIAKDFPEIKTSLVQLYEARTKALAKSRDYDEAQKSFKWIQSHRPDPSAANNRLRRDLIGYASGVQGKLFAKSLVEQLAELDNLGSIEEIYFYFRGYYGEGVLLATFLITVAVIVALLGGVFVLGKFFPSLSFEGVPERFEAFRRKRLEKRNRKRGVGYMTAVDVDDEYSRLLAEFGLDDSATTSDIKKAYRQMVKEHHPDAHGAAGVVTDEEGNVDRTFEELKKNYQRLLNMKSSYFGG